MFRFNSNKPQDKRIRRLNNQNCDTMLNQSQTSTTLDESDTFMEEPFSNKSCDNNSSDDDATDNEDDKAFSEALQTFNEICKTEPDYSGNAALQGFAQMIFSTIEEMDKNKQIKAMLRVTEVVMQIKMEDDN